MKPCDHLPQYLDGRLERAGREYFESHLNICSECRELANAWLCTKNALKNEARERQLHLVPTDAEASRLVQRAQLEASSRGFFSVRVLVPLTACVSFAAAFFAVYQLNLHGMLPQADEETAPVSTATAPTRTVPTVETAPMSATAIKPALEYETKQDGRTTGRLGKDRFGLAPESRLRVVSTEGKITRLELDRGFAAFSVSKRTNGRKFIVEAGEYRVEVVGTRFTVDHRGDGIKVAVTEGVVKVFNRDGRNWRVAAGQAVAVFHDGTELQTEASEEATEETALLLGETAIDPLRAAALTAVAGGGEALAALFDTDDRSPNARPAARFSVPLRKNRDMGENLSLTEETAESVAQTETEESQKTAESESPDAEPVIDIGPKGIDLWRQWILEGCFEAAENALTDHLSDHPMDTEAYSLLADCRRKAGKYAEAVETYKKLTAIAGEFQANRARFKAGVLMQENLKNHLGAAAIFDDYLTTDKGTPLLRAKATVRLANSLIELGETERAEKLLSRIVSDYSGSSVAIQAREMLQRIR